MTGDDINMFALNNLDSQALKRFQKASEPERPQRRTDNLFLHVAAIGQALTRGVTSIAKTIDTNAIDLFAFRDLIVVRGNHNRFDIKLRQATSQQRQKDTRIITLETGVVMRQKEQIDSFWPWPIVKKRGQRTNIIFPASLKSYIPALMNQSKHKAGLEFTADLDFADILTNPILDIAARVWESDRYEAFQVCYRSMRTIDDLVDDRKESGEPLTPTEIARYETMLSEWLVLLEQGDASDDFRAALLGVIRRFHLPVWPWQRLGKAMIYDLSYNGFASFYVFRHYAEGAAVAPASIFMHLCGINRRRDAYDPPIFDIAAMARDLALFSYCTHIIRDFQKDHLRHLNYFADNLLVANDLTVDTLQWDRLPVRTFRPDFGNW